MRFVHIADAHIGCWRDPAMKELSVDAFQQACETAIDNDVDFILIAGDLFHTAIPNLDLVRSVVRILQGVNDHDIPCYFIPGSHDCSPTGKTMLNVIEEANLGVNVARTSDDSLVFTETPTGVKLTGISGEQGMLDQQSYDDIDRDRLAQESGDTVFMFHTAIDELKPDDLPMESKALRFLPRGFDYYAGGHVHVVDHDDFSDNGYAPVVYPGPLFPTAFNELEDIQQGGFYLYDNGNLNRHTVRLKDVVNVDIAVDEQQPDTATESVINELRSYEVSDAIVTIRLHGELVGGRISDIDFDSINSYLDGEDAFHVLTNTNSLQTESFSADVDEDRTHDEIEAELIQEYAGQVDHAFDDEIQTVKELLTSLNEEKQDGETNTDYEERMLSEAKTLLKSHLSTDDEEGEGTVETSEDESLAAFIDD